MKQQISALNQQNLADQSVERAMEASKKSNNIHICDFRVNKRDCKWSKDIKLGQIFDQEMFTIDHPPNHLQLAVKFEHEPHSDPKCHINVLLGLNEVCKLTAIGNTDITGDKQIKPIGHQICQLQFGGDKIQNCAQCNGASFDLHAVAKSIDVERPTSISKGCLIIQPHTIETGGSNGCQTKANIAFKQSKHITNHQISCVPAPKKMKKLNNRNIKKKRTLFQKQAMLGEVSMDIGQSLQQLHVFWLVVWCFLDRLLNFAHRDRIKF